MKRSAIVLLAGAILIVAASGIARAQGEEGGSQLTKREKAELFRRGAQLWLVYCAQCHNARPGSEFAPYQWDQIMMHMRGLSNMPAQNARAIVEYLKGGRE